MSRSATIEHRLTTAARGTWRLDPAHSSAIFSVRHLMSRVRGRFGDLDGGIVIGGGLDSCSVAVAIAARTVDTGVPMRDDDLRSASFLDVANFESMTFESSEVHDRDDVLVVVGDLTIRGVTRPVILQAEYLGRDDTGLQGEPRVGFSAQTTILRSDYGVGENSAKGSKVMVGDMVTIELDVEAFLED
jgi:polyisoprenoid-binding protein YceI